MDSVFADELQFKPSDEIYAIRLRRQWMDVAAIINEHLCMHRFEVQGVFLPEVEERLRQCGLFDVETLYNCLRLTWRQPFASKKRFVGAEELRIMAQTLASQIYRSGFRPTHLVGVWRGGCPVALYVHEYLKRLGLAVDHTALRTSLYEGVDRPGSEVRVHGEQ